MPKKSVICHIGVLNVCFKCWLFLCFINQNRISKNSEGNQNKYFCISSELSDAPHPSRIKSQVEPATLFQEESRCKAGSQSCGRFMRTLGRPRIISCGGDDSSVSWPCYEQCTRLCSTYVLIQSSQSPHKTAGYRSTVLCLALAKCQAQF